MTREDANDPLLSSDALGEKGEAKFADLCTDANLIVNRVGRDRSGWDFVVQQDAVAAPHIPLDARPALWTYFVQVKAVWRDQGRARIRLTLAAAERIAKQSDPAYIAAFRFNRNDLADYDLYLIELADEQLATILKALRQAQADGARAVNARTIHIPLLKKDRVVPASGAQIRQVLARAHQGAAEPYSSRKTHQLQTLGYGPDRLKAQITLHDVDLPKVLDLLLGQTSCVATLSNVTETRFGISLPVDEGDTAMGEVRATSTTERPCSLVVEGGALSSRLRFDGAFKHASLPAAKGLITRQRFDFGGFTIVSTHEPPSLTTTMTSDEHRPAPLKTWLDFHRVYLALAMDPPCFTLRSPHRKKPSEWRFPRTQGANLPDIRARLSLFEALELISKVTDADFKEMTADDVFSRQKEILTARYVGLPGDQNVRITLPSVHRPEPEAPSRTTLFINFLDIAGRRIVYAGLAVFVPQEGDDDTAWRTEQLNPIDIRRIDDSEDEFRDFVTACKAKTGLDEVLMPDADHGFVARALGEFEEF